MNIQEKLMEVQQTLKAPKNQTNSFGGYKYRSCEDILKAVKPILKKVKCLILLNDEITVNADMPYCIATALFIDTESQETITATGCAREPFERKGMDASQISGATSSYARKYALNGLLAIDDAKDADFTNKHGNSAPTKAGKQAQVCNVTKATPVEGGLF